MVPINLKSTLLEASWYRINSWLCLVALIALTEVTLWHCTSIAAWIQILAMFTTLVYLVSYNTSVALQLFKRILKAKVYIIQ